MWRGRTDRGQAAVEYVVVVATVAALLAMGTAVTAPGLVNGVLAAFQRAVCLVGGGDCLAGEPRPCVVRAAGRDEAVTLHAALIRIGHHAGILREDLSDGTVDVTRIDDLSAGGELALGGRARLAAGDMRVDLGGGVSVGGGAWLGHTRTFHVRDRRAAEALVRRLVHGSSGTLLLELPVRAIRHVLGLGGRDGVPAADRVTFAGGAYGAAGLRGIVRGAELDAVLRASLGGEWDRRSGRRTFYLRVEGEAEQALRQAFGAVLREEGMVHVGVTFDRAGRPLELGISLTGAGEAGIVLPPGLRVIADMPPRGGRRVELEAALDLTPADNAEAVRRFVAALRPSGAVRVAGAAGDLARRLATDGRLDVRAFATASSSEGVGADIALGVKGGAEVEVVRTSSRLLAAYTRPAGGLWESRIDCVRL